MGRKDKKKKKEEEEELETYEESDYSSSYDESYESERPVEGEIIYEGGSQEGLAAQINVIENVNVEQDHDMEVSAFEFTGSLEIKNPSTIDRIWDIKANLENIEKTNLEQAEIYVQELGTEEEENVDSREFEISGEAENRLLVKEFISTLPEAYENWNIADLEKEMLKGRETGEEETGLEEEEVEEEEEWESEMEEGEEDEELPTESFGISINKVNNIMFLIALRSTFEKPVKDISVVKEMPLEFENVMIVDSTLGYAEQEGNQITWTIDELEPEITAYVQVSAEIQVESKDPVKTGTIEVTYRAASSFTGGLGVESFEAYTHNRFHIDLLERDEEPGMWDCALVFENPSEFTIDLYSAQVQTFADPETQLVSIPEEEPIRLPAGAKWNAPAFELQSDEIPTMRKRMDFRVLHEFSTEVNGTIAISDVDLVLASITGELTYLLPEEEEAEEEIEEEAVEEGVPGAIIKVPTFKESEVNAVLTITNDGSAPLNEVKWQQRYFDEEFQPPNLDEVVCLWNGEEIELDPEQMKFEDNILLIEFKNLKDTDRGMFEADDTLEFQYPIHVVNPARDAQFESETIINANTYPKSKELEYIPEPDEMPIIEAVHVRRKYRMGKHVVPIGGLGEYEIILFVRNVGNMPLKDIVVQDKVPDNFERSDFSEEPEITDLEGEDILKWGIKKIQPDEEIEITYRIAGTGDYNPSDAQVAY